MPAYTNTISFADLKNNLAQKLFDPTKVFFTDQELGLHLQDAIRFYNILTGDNRVTYALNLTSGQVWYDLNTLAGSPRLASFTASDVYTRCQLALMEGGTPLTLLTTQFSADDFVSSLQMKRDEMLLKSKVTRSIRTINVSPSSETVTLPEEVILASRAYWLPADPSYGNPFPLPKSDSYADTGYQPYAYQTAADPKTFSSGMESPMTVILTPPPMNPGQVEFLTVEDQVKLTLANPDAVMNIPTDFGPALMWGVLSNLLTNSIEASDPMRAEYAEKRYEQIVELLDRYPFVMTARTDSGAIYVDAVEVLDSYSPNWRTTTALPRVLGIAGQNLLACPTSMDQTITLKMTANANVPVNDTDQIQLNRDVLDAILDYAQHTISFKMGSVEFQQTFPLLQSIAEVAAARNRDLKTTSFYNFAMNTRPQREEEIETANQKGDE